MADNKKPIHAYLAERHHAAWHDQADELGVSVSGLIGAVAEDMMIDPSLEDQERLERLAKRARKIDAENRRRGGGRAA